MANEQKDPNTGIKQYCPGCYYNNKYDGGCAYGTEYAGTAHPRRCAEAIG